MKGSGWDLEFIEAAGFSPVRMEHLIRLAQLPAAVRPADGERAAHPHDPRLGADAVGRSRSCTRILPHRYVDHTHADAVITVTNTAKGLERIREIYGEHCGSYSLRDARLRPGAAVRRAVSQSEAAQEHDRHGAHEPRHLLLRRNRAAILRTHDRARHARRGLSRETQGLAVAGRCGKAIPRPAAPGAGRAAAHAVRSRRISRDCRGARRRREPRFRASRRTLPRSRSRVRRRRIT